MLYETTARLDVPAQYVFESAGYLFGMYDGSPTSVRKFSTDGALVGSRAMGETTFYAIHVGGILYAAIGAGVLAGSINRLDTANIAGTLTTISGFFAAGEPQGVAHDGTNLWVTTTYSGTLLKLNATTLALDTTYPINAGIGAMAYASGSLWICDRASDEIIEWDIAGGVEAQRFACVSFPLDIAVANGLVFVVGGLEIGVYDASTGAQVHAFAAEARISHQGLAHWGSYIATANPSLERVLLLDDTTGALAGYLSVPDVYGVAGASTDALFIATGPLGELTTIAVELV